ncbi:MAG: hypothetical protein CYPHOPRED_001574 [Cyphobasidiales sp. Tagirdzhanova-0007]|nr:MAG: hypothetical protein CYPHOPRED_001574 [Cyphobasidiales sp. Tagirdzhanova-0007]
MTIGSLSPPYDRRSLNDITPTDVQRPERELVGRRRQQREREKEKERDGQLAPQPRSRTVEQEEQVPLDLLDEAAIRAGARHTALPIRIHPRSPGYPTRELANSQADREGRAAGARRRHSVELGAWQLNP